MDSLFADFPLGGDKCLIIIKLQPDEASKLSLGERVEAALAFDVFHSEKIPFQVKNCPGLPSGCIISCPFI